MGNVFCRLGREGLNVISVVCRRMELCFSSIRILKLCFSTYAGFNVLLQSAIHPGFSSGRTLCNSAQTVLYGPHTVQYACSAAVLR